MIQNFVFTAPLGDADPVAVQAKAETDIVRVARSHRYLLGYTVQAANGALRVMLRVSTTDRWKGSAAARRIAATVLRRLGLDWRVAVLESVEIERNARSLTGEQGRPSRV